MNLEKIYQIAIEKGIKHDPRGKKEISEILKEKKEKFENLKKEEKKFFDNDQLWNPYSDSRILASKKNNKIETVLVGIDVETPEILLANELRKNGQKIDLLITHHPEGRALINFSDVIWLQRDFFSSYGIPINVAEKHIAPRIAEISRSINSTNFDRAVQAANLLNFNFLGIHTPADNCVYDFLTRQICSQKFRNLKNVVKELEKIPEYLEVKKMGNSPLIAVGSENSRPGKIVAAEMTGGTSGSEKMFAEMKTAGIGTILSMHTTEKFRKEAEENQINIIICPHMASDSIGLNLILDELEKKGLKKIIPVSGFIRFSRQK